MRKSTSDTTEFLFIIIALALLFFVLEYLNITVNRIYIIIPFLLIWITVKMILRKKSQ